MNIHQFVDELKDRFESELLGYLREMLSSVAMKLSEEHHIPCNEIMESIDHILNNSVKKCKKITKQGHPCKYDSKLGESFCIKHTNLHLHQKRINII